uniref:UMOD/GP2/OIT3-like D8C domain-containing protein n=1 Tax=Maylandia zebra TaxID=106582 RepID=A0A3P9DSN3_9CICH
MLSALPQYSHLFIYVLTVNRGEHNNICTFFNHTCSNTTDLYSQSGQAHFYNSSEQQCSSGGAHPPGWRKQLVFWQGGDLPQWAVGDGDIHCDQSINWQGWYRLFLGSSNARIPERCIDSNRCGTHAPLWITQPHPSQPGETVTRTVCNNWSGSCCQFPSHTIQVKLCYGNYYVYKLERPSVCHLAYCAGIVAL